MDFLKIETMGKRIFEQFPVVKRSAKRIYQLASVAASGEKIQSEGDLTRVSPDDGYEYFYGYYDKSPWDASDRYMICVRVEQAYRSVAPKEPGTVGVLDTQDHNRFIPIGATHAWNVQQSCMAQWMGPDFATRILYNDFRDGRYCAVIYNVREGREEKALPMAAYDVARDGAFFLSLDFSRLHRLRPGYGYSNLPDETKGELCPDRCCIWKVDIRTGEITELFKYTDFAAFEPDESMNGAEHKVNHLMISPNGKRFMVLHRWFQKGRKHTRLVTVNIDGTDMYNLSDDVFVSHCYWKNDGEILSFLRKKGTGDHYYLMRDRTREYRMCWPELNTDGHCSYSPDGKTVVTDTYPNRKRMASVYLCTEEDNRSERIARVFSPFKYDNDCRCDLHPRWNRAGDRICIDSVHEGKRGLYVMGIPARKPAAERQETSVIPRIIHSVWVGGGKKSDVVNQCRVSWSKYCPDYRIIEWNEENFDLENTCDYVRQAYKSKKWAFVSDYIRLCVLYEYGGIYLDTDSELIGSLEPFLQNDGFVCTESHQTLSLGIIGVKPKSEWIAQLLKEYKVTPFINEKGEMNQLPINKRVQRLFETRYRYHWSNQIQQYDDGMVVYPSEYFSPINPFTGIKKVTEKTVMIHHYDNTWKSKKDKIKRRMMQLGTRVIGEDNRARIVKLFHRAKR